MLAVQRPSMGSSKPSNLDMPFGYSFDTSTSNFPFPSPTAPAPGPSLLDDNETKFLDSFFDGVNSDHFDYDLFSNGPDGSETGFGWDGLPPTFMGTTSSFGQQPQIGHPTAPELNFTDMNSQVPTESPIQSSTSADVLAAATLLQNGSNGRSHSIADGTLFRGQDVSVQPTNGHVRPQSMSQYSTSRQFQAAQERPASDEFLRDTFFSDMVFGGGTSARPRLVNQKMDIRWGSDASFGTPQGFLAPGDQDKVAEVERIQIQSIETALRVSRSGMPSTDNSRPPSPTSATKSHGRAKSSGNINDEAEQDSRPRKRRKNKSQDDEDEELLVSGQNGNKRRKSVKKENNSSPVEESEQGHKRRKSTAANNAAARAARENLTEDQKRENHIKSEQKRRTLIREGFEDLGELVPGLRGGGFSKSAVLIMAADWLESLIQGNELLQGQLDQMEGR